MQRITHRAIAALFFVFAAQIITSTAEAQSGLAQAVLALDNGPAGPIRLIDSRLFGARVQARIIDRNNNGADFDDVDEVEFTISRGSEALPFLEGVRTRASFEDWARRNADSLLRIIFPASLSSVALGRDAGQLYAQQLLLSTALDVGFASEPGAPRRSSAGGLVEYEWSAHDDSRPDDSLRAWQGLYSFNRFMSVQGRYARTQEDLSTRALGASFDYHPYREKEVAKDVIVRVGGTARAGFVYSHSQLIGARDSIDLGTIDVGGGGWASVRKNFRLVRIGGGTLFQGTRSHMPTIGDPELNFLADVMNSRGIAWDIAYGGTAAVNTSPSTAVIAKYLESRPVNADVDRAPLHLLLAGYSFTLAPGRAMDVGYKITSSAGMRSGSVFVQGNFGW